VAIGIGLVVVGMGIAISGVVQEFVHHCLQSTKPTQVRII